MNNMYSRSLQVVLRHRIWTLPVIVLMLGAIVYLWGAIPSEMAPLEDRSMITINTRGAEGVTYEYIRDYTEDINSIVDSVIPDADAVTARVSGGSGNVQIRLKDMGDRDYTQMEAAENCRKPSKRNQSTCLRATTILIRRASFKHAYTICFASDQHREVGKKSFRYLWKKSTRTTVFQMADVDLKFSKPEIRIHINRDKANIMGVNTRDLSETLQYGLSGQRMGYFYMNGKQYEILGEINRQQRNKPADLRAIYLRSSDGKMIQMDNLIELESSIALETFTVTTVSFPLRFQRLGRRKNYRTKDWTEMDKIAKEVLDDTFRTSLSGDSKEFRESSSSLMFAFILALVLIYLILAAQFESFKDPFIIMLTVPLAIAGALIFMYFNDITMNVFSQIGIIMLIGLVAKNGILIVEFANLKQRKR